MKYKERKPRIVEAIQLTKTNIVDICYFINDYKNYPECPIGGVNPTNGQFMLWIVQIGCWDVVRVGEYIVKNKNGSLLNWTEKEFKKTYTPAE